MSFVAGAWYYFDDGLIKQYDKPVLIAKPDLKEQINDPVKRRSAVFCMPAAANRSRFTGLVLLEGVKNLQPGRLEEILGGEVETFMARDDFDLDDLMINALDE